MPWAMGLDFWKFAVHIDPTYSVIPIFFLEPCEIARNGQGVFIISLLQITEEAFPTWHS